MTYAIITPPAAEPLALAHIRGHLRIDGTAEDALLQDLAVVARRHLEAVTGLALISQVQRLYLDCWPSCGVVDIARGPVQAIDAVRVYDADGSESSVDLAGHRLDPDARPARLWLRQRPRVGSPLNGVEIDFSAGFGEAGTDVPDTLLRAMLIHVALMFEFRGAITTDLQPAAIPEGYERLVAPYLMRRL